MTHSVGMCFGLLEGVRNTIAIGEDAFATCQPSDGITNGHAVRIVLSYLRKNPQKLHFDRTGC
jgi:hypothetical protein